MTNIKDVDFWINDIAVLYKNNNYLHFIPSNEMHRNEQLNAISRFCIYFIIIVILLHSNKSYIPIAILIFVIILFYLRTFDKDSNKKELNRILNNRRIKKKQTYNDYESINDEEKDYTENFKNEDNNNKYDLEAKYYDYTNKLYTGKSKEKVLSENIFNYDEITEFEKNTCRKPTENNPFMNINVVDLNKEDIAAACNADDEDIKDEIKKHFDKNLYQNVEDLWEKKNSQVNFYTLPNTKIPNDQQGFAEFLYKIPEICKTDQKTCLRYEDIRFKI